jgi:hypothetical protein
VELVDPAGHAYPAVQFPEHAAVVSPDDDPKVPAGHGAVHDADGKPAVAPYSPALQLVQAEDPSGANCPAGHNTALEFTDPAGHAYPSRHLPLHDEVDIPTEEPNCPPGHRPHCPAPTKLNVPIGHSNAVAFVDPSRHAYPAVQFPEHTEDVSPDIDPNVPAGHGAVQLDVFSPLLDPYSPALQFVHTPAPPRLYVPTGHIAAVALTDPTTHA